MSARLVVLEGQMAGATLAVAGNSVAGRSADSDILLPDPSVSRRHCQFLESDGTWSVDELTGRNATFVNGEQTKRHALAHGDRLQLGELLLQFLVDETDGPLRDEPDAQRRVATPAVTLDGPEPSEGSTLELRLENASLLQARDAGRRASDRLVSDLNALVRISRSLNELADPEELQERLLDLVFEAIPARRGAILLADLDGRIVSTVVRDAGGQKAGTLRVSRTVADRVLREGVALLVNDAQADGALSTSDSVRLLAINAVLCVPLGVAGRRLGALYLHSDRPRRLFDEGHLELATAIAALAGVALENARRIAWAEAEVERLRDDLDHDLIGTGAKIRDVLAFVAKVAPKDTTVLVRGESGTGKELLARALHRNSSRAKRSFVAINCAAMPEALLESELFGHEKGAFTGASAQKKGKVELADGGTLFLDEIGELAPTLQAKLLRVLQEREIERVGGARPIKVDVRLIAATNRDLEEAIKAGTFRQDLFYRLDVVSTTLPPLRDRREDVEALSRHFLARLRQRFGGPEMRVSPEARACLMAHDWPGNVRELENALERAVVLANGDLITPEDLPEALLDARPSPAEAGSDFHEAVKATKRRLILEAFEKAGRSYTETAKLLGLNANYLHRLVKNLDLKSSMR